MEIYVQIFIWILCWIIVKGGFYYFSKNETYYLTHTGITTNYFFLSSIIMYLIYSSVLNTLIFSLPYHAWILLGAFILLVIFIYFLAPYLFSPEQLNSNKYVFTRMSKKYLLAKMFEITFQQLLIITITILFSQTTFSYPSIYLLFAFLFGVLHLPLLKIRGKHIGIYFSIAAVFAGFLFPYVILNFKLGIIYSFIIHWSFYILSALIYNWYKKVRT